MVRSWPSIAFGTICVVGTIIVLFGHIRSIDDLTLNHLYIILALMVTLGAGHFMWESRNPFIIVSFALLFVVGTIVCVGLSGGRSAEILANKERAARDLAEKREAQEAIIERAKALATQASEDADAAERITEEARKLAADECATGKGPKCDGKTVSYEQARAAALDARARARKLEEDYRHEVEVYNALPLPPPPNADLMSFARVWAYISGQTQDEAMEEIKLFLPYMFALLTEFGTIMFFKHGFGPKPTASRIITLAELSEELKMDPKHLRKTLRAMNVSKPASGWQWEAAEAATIARRVIAHRTSSPNTVH